MFRRLMFTVMYWFTRPRWDTNVTPPELVALVERLPPGRALDLGCGTGTNVIYLAEHGWRPVGVDFVGKAIATARRKAQAAGVEAGFHRADVTSLDFLAPPFDLAVDIGCFHSIPEARRAAYLDGVRRLLRPGGHFLLYAFKPGRLAGIAVEDVLALFAEGFRDPQVEHGQGLPSAWYTFVRD